MQTGTEPAAEARERAREMRRRAETRADEQKRSVAREVHSLAGALRAAAAHLDAEERGPTADYAHRAADFVDRFGNDLDQKSLGDLFEDIQRATREQPAMAVGLAALAGFVGTRFLRSTERTERIDIEVEEPVTTRESWNRDPWYPAEEV